LDSLIDKGNFKHIEMKGYSRNILVRWASGIFMMLVLLWLTVSTPFVNAFQMQIAEREQALHKDCKSSCKEKEEAASECNPFANTTEEKTESSASISFSEEFLHDHHEQLTNLDDILEHAKCGHSALYIAFHGELLSPPPEV
jgi:hypothetical protein